ncbi:hypothetical protein BCR42DRAFT_395154 [Absidia repens]|uniref:Uncharacterized protein n=1 Tax=Absidia repens TaxID=90262 RepID=A0A1X2I9S2_9FUNG|nr:hypothetical protein BCR42DRAFT_395154 [Absidia repens]
MRIELLFSFNFSNIGNPERIKAMAFILRLFIIMFQPSLVFPPYSVKEPQLPSQQPSPPFLAQEKLQSDYLVESESDPWLMSIGSIPNEVDKKTMTALEKEETHLCVDMVLNMMTVLTVAHCVRHATNAILDWYRHGVQHAPEQIRLKLFIMPSVSRSMKLYCNPTGTRAIIRCSHPQDHGSKAFLQHDTC